MAEELLNASGAEVVQPQDNMSAEDAEVTQPQTVDIDSMSEEEFQSYLDSISDDAVQPVKTDEPLQENEPEDTAQATDDAKPSDETPFKVFKTQEEWQNEIDGIIGKRLKESRERTENYDNIIGIAKDFYGGDNPVEALVQDLQQQAAEKKHITPEQYAQHRILEQKAQQWDAQQQTLQAQQKQQETLRLWQTQADELRKTVPDFDFEKALAEKEFYDRIVKGYTVADAYNLTKKSPPQTVVHKRKAVMQGAAHSQAGGSADVDVSKMTDKEFMRYINKCKEE